MTIPIANYETEYQAFEELLVRDCLKSILMFRGESGSGKTTLLTHCLTKVPQSVPLIPIQLRGSAVSVGEIFNRTGGKLGWENLVSFTKQVADLQGTPKVNIDRNWLAGINNRITIALQAEKVADREDRRVALTETLFADLKQFREPLLFVFDTYEHATTETQDWISGPFLARITGNKQVRILIAGQSVPQEHNIEWGHCCKTHHLFGVPDAKHWMPIVKALKRRIPFDDPIIWLAGVCHALNGRPKDIMQIIKGLPIQESS